MMTCSGSFTIASQSTRIDRKSGSAGMPRSTLFPYTTLFRSIGDRPRSDWHAKGYEVEQLLYDDMLGFIHHRFTEYADRSEERFSRNAEIYTLSLHDALPIYW